MTEESIESIDRPSIIAICFRKHTPNSIFLQSKCPQAASLILIFWETNNFFDSALVALKMPDLVLTENQSTKTDCCTEEMHDHCSINDSRLWRT